MKFEAQDETMAAPSADNLYQLLVFADAVDTNAAFLTAAVRAYLASLCFHVNLGSQELQLGAAGVFYCFSYEKPLQLRKGKLAGGGGIVAEAAKVEGKVAFMAQLAGQVEQLLYIGLKLQLQDLVDAVKGFIYASMIFDETAPLLWTVRDQVFSNKVVDAAAGTGWGKEALQRSVTGEYLSDILMPTAVPKELQEPVRFTASLSRDFMGENKGAEVPVTLTFRRGARDMVKIDGSCCMSCHGCFFTSM